MSSDEGINRCPHIIAINQKYFSNKAQDFSESSEYLFLSSFYVTKWLFFLSWNKKSWSLPLFAKFLGGPFSFSNLQSSLWVTFWLTLQYLPTLIRKSLSVPATSTQTGWYGCWKKEGFVFQENLSTCDNSWRTVLSVRLLLSLQCVFDTKLTPFIYRNGFACNVMDS